MSVTVYFNGGRFYFENAEDFESFLQEWCEGFDYCDDENSCRIELD